MSEDAKPIIYVDGIVNYPASSLPAHIRRVGTGWCHLWVEPQTVEGIEALHAFAARIGMRRQWFQNRPGFPHYDLVKARRQAALKLGAVPMDLRDWIRMRESAPKAQEFKVQSFEFEVKAASRSSALRRELMASCNEALPGRE